MKYRPNLLTATLMCSLASGPALALERDSLRLAQAEGQADPSPDKGAADAGDKQQPKVREKKLKAEDRGESDAEAPPRQKRERADPALKKAAPVVREEGLPPEKPVQTKTDKDQPASPKVINKTVEDPESKAAPRDAVAPGEKRKRDVEKKPAASEPKELPKVETSPVVEPKTSPKEDVKSDPPATATDAPAAVPKVTATPPPEAAPKADAPAAPAAAPANSAPGKDAVREKQPDAAAGPAVKDMKQLKADRKERTEDGGKRIVIEEPGKRTIIKEGGRTIIRHDETERFRRLSNDQRVERRDGVNIFISVRPGGIQIFTEQDDRGRPLRRYRRDRDGRDVILFDNRDYYRRHAGAALADVIIDLRPPRFDIPRRQYIVDYDDASDEDIYVALSAPPVEKLDRTYSLQEVRYSSTLRDRMRRVDLDAINFEFGSWEVASDQYPKLERVARAMKRVVEANPAEVFLIEGHTDAVGSDEDNLSLSDRRAETVAIILTEEFGVPPENLTSQGYGEQYLKVETESEERQNRRVAVRRVTPLLSQGN